MLQHNVNHELPDVQSGFRKSRGTRDQIANIHSIIEKARKFQKKTSTSASLTMLKPLDFPHSSVGKESAAMQETQVRFLGWEDPLEKKMATHSSILAWRIPWTQEPGGLQSMGSQELETT